MHKDSQQSVNTFWRPRCHCWWRVHAFVIVCKTKSPSSHISMRSTSRSRTPKYCCKIARRPWSGCCTCEKSRLQSSDLKRLTFRTFSPAIKLVAFCQRWMHPKVGAQRNRKHSKMKILSRYSQCVYVGLLFCVLILFYIYFLYFLYFFGLT